MSADAQTIDLNNPEFLTAWQLVRSTNQSVFLTGKAGTGKSTFLRYITDHTDKNYVVLAPTGIAAVTSLAALSMTWLLSSRWLNSISPLCPPTPRLPPRLARLSR